MKERRYYWITEMDFNFKSPLSFARTALVALGLGVFSAPAFSQNCALCYSQASASGSRMIDALRSGQRCLVGSRY